MRYVVVPRSKIDKLEQRIRLLEVEKARQEWLAAQYRALERSHERALGWIRAHRCHVSPLASAPEPAAVVDATVVDISGRYQTEHPGRPG